MLLFLKARFANQQYVQAGKDRQVGLWLFATAVGVFSMILVGGYTRLSGSGLSMTSWKPLLPNTDQKWQAQFKQYQKYPEFKLVNKDISMQGFKKIFFIEWFHRALGLSLGVGFVFPLMYFLRRGYLLGPMKRSLLGLLGVGSAQGAIGWWMVKSGLEEKPKFQIKPKVSPYRLTVHLLTATFIYTRLLWLSMKLLARPSQDAVSSPRMARLLPLLLLKLVLLNIFSGSIVSGIDAGKMYNTWPDMNGQLYPEGLLKLTPFYKNFFQNHAFVQFNHRLLAYFTFFLSASIPFIVKGSPRFTRAALLTFGLVSWQVVLGILTLLQMSPVHKASAHQCTGFLTLSSVLRLLMIGKLLA